MRSRRSPSSTPCPPRWLRRTMAEHHAVQHPLFSSRQLSSSSRRCRRPRDRSSPFRRIWAVRMRPSLRRAWAARSSPPPLPPISAAPTSPPLRTSRLRAYSPSRSRHRSSGRPPRSRPSPAWNSRPSTATPGRPLRPRPPTAPLSTTPRTPRRPVVHETGAHEAGGRNSGHVDLNGVRIPPASAAPTPPPRRPLHMGPPMPESSGGVVRSLADRGPAGTAPHPLTVQNHPGPPTTGPEYLDIPQSEAASVLPGPQLGEIPPQAGAPWDPQPPQAHTQTSVPAETVVPEATPDPSCHTRRFCRACRSCRGGGAGAPAGAGGRRAVRAGRGFAAQCGAPGADACRRAGAARRGAGAGAGGGGRGRVRARARVPARGRVRARARVPARTRRGDTGARARRRGDPGRRGRAGGRGARAARGRARAFAVQEQAPVVEVPVVPEPLAEPQPIADVAEPEPVADQPVAEVQPDGRSGARAGTGGAGRRRPAACRAEDAADEEPAAAGARADARRQRPRPRLRRRRARGRHCA